MSKLQPVTIVVAIVALSVTLFAPVEAQQRERSPNDTASKLTGVLKQMHGTCQQLVQLRTKEYHTGKVGVRQLFSAQQQLFDIELKLAKTADERKIALTKCLGLAKDTEKIVVAQYRAGKAPQSDVLESQLSRMNIEMLMLKEPS